VAGKGPAPESTSSFGDPLIIGLILGALYIGGWALWHFEHANVARLYAYGRYIEFYLVHAIGGVAPIPGIGRVHAWIEELCTPDGWHGPCTRDFSELTWEEIRDSSTSVNMALLIWILAYAAYLFKRVNANHPKLKHARPHTIMSFVAELKNATSARDGKLLYPHLRMFSALNLIEEPLDDPVFGMSLTSKQFAFKYRLILGWRAQDGGFWAPTLDRVRAAEVFREQLGRHWSSSANLSPGETLMAAVTMPRVAATDATLDEKAFKAAMDASDDMVRYCWQQFEPPAAKHRRSKSAATNSYDWLKPQINLSAPRAVIQRYIGHPAVQELIRRHAFARTVLFALFQHGRRLGVLPPADVRWLRFYDRPLWYAVQNFGRESGFGEGAAFLSHYLYEARARTAIVEPQLDKAVSGLETALLRFKFTAVEKNAYQSTEAPSPPHPASWTGVAQNNE
jgi:intracellular multiplication protein IcmP